MDGRKLERNGPGPLGTLSGERRICTVCLLWCCLLLCLISPWFMEGEEVGVHFSPVFMD